MAREVVSSSPKWDIPIGDEVECSCVAREVVSSSPARGTPYLRVTNGAVGRMGLWPLSPGADG